MYKNISEQTVECIHQAISSSSSVAGAAKCLRVGDTTLASHLGKFLLSGTPLTYSRLQRMSVADALDIWGSAYLQAMSSPIIDIQNYTGAHLHEICLNTNFIREAANQLGVRDHTLARRLKQFLFQGKSLSFERLKELSSDEARQVFGEAYDPLIRSPRINLTPDKHTVTVGFIEPDDFDCLASIFNDEHAVEADTHYWLQESAFSLSGNIYGLFSAPTRAESEEPLPKKRRRAKC